MITKIRIVWRGDVILYTPSPIYLPTVGGPCQGVFMESLDIASKWNKLLIKEGKA